MIEVKSQCFTQDIAGGDSLAFGGPDDAGFELGIDESTDEHLILGALIWHAVVIYTMLNIHASSMFDWSLPYW